MTDGVHILFHFNIVTTCL